MNIVIDINIPLFFQIPFCVVAVRMRTLHLLARATVVNCVGMPIRAIATPSGVAIAAMPRIRTRIVRPWTCPRRWRPAIAPAQRSCVSARWSVGWTGSIRCGDARVRCRSAPPTIRTASGATEVCATMHQLFGGRRKSVWLRIRITCRITGGHFCSTGGLENSDNNLQ